MAIDRALAVFRAAALERAVRGRDARVTVEPLLRGRLARSGGTVDLAADLAVRCAAVDLLSHGWSPTEVHRFAVRRFPPLVVGYLCDALAAAAQWTAYRPWLAELAELDARVWWSSGEPHLRQWRRVHRLRRADAIAVVIDVLAVLEHVPRTDLPLSSVGTAPASARRRLA